MTTESGRRLMARLSGRSAEADLLAAADELRKADPNLTQEEAIAKAAEVNPALHTKALKESGVPSAHDPSPPQPTARVAKAAPSLPGVDAALQLDELVTRYATVANIAKVDAYPIVLASKEGAVFAAASYAEAGDIQKSREYHEASQTAAPFHEVVATAKAERDDAIAKRLLELAG